ncbi:unnamed protein product [Rotaria socialis]|uniref:Uncharacterized protein n=1 Tax=Rotaria socialis TaxID=392032 RepID=A0A817M8B9_9BILA|nr:unnamed protein product [Rotaria socialis]CAF3773184.1 unnamed protein product [Rotaria socialis]CAF4106739.1 unnamed protein product [Rotaria socialis]CAF4452676.1 unnamed protein product [Rotaria socialis]
MFDTFNTLFDTLRSLLTSNEAIDVEKIETITSNKSNFLSITSNSPQNVAQRNALSRADIDGIQFDTLTDRRKLPRLFIDECFAISDLFQLNEYDSLLLLIEGESLQSSYPDCTRGLLAVQLYYESKERLAACLAYLMGCLTGRTFQSLLKISKSIEFCTTFVNELVEKKLIENIIEQLITFQIRNEEQRLYSKAGLGNVKHRRRVQDSIKHIRSFQAKSIFLYSCQIRLTQSHLLSIINYLAKYSTIQDDGIIDESTLYLLGAFLYGITLALTIPNDASIGSSSIITAKYQQFSLQEDQPLSPLEDNTTTSPSSIDPALIIAIRDILSNDERWIIPELKAVCQLAWAIILRARSHTLPDGHIYSEDIEALADIAVEAHVFAFLSETVIKSSLIQQEEFLIRRFHMLFVDFIYYLPFKLKELRVQAEDTARMIEDCERARKPLPDNLQRDYEYFLELLSTFYANDHMNLHLSEEFWIAADALAGHRMMQSPTQQQVALANFVESAGGTLSAYLYCHYIHMLAGISSTQSSAHACFELLRFAKDTGGPTCWNRIFQAFLLYRNTYRPDTLLNQQPQTSFGASPSTSAIKTIAPKEVTALIAVLNLIEVIAAQDEVSRIGFFEHPQWQITGAFFGLLSCRISLDLKAALFNTLSAFTKTAEIAMHFWKIIGEIDLFAPMENSDMPAIAYEIEEFEVPTQKYTFLKSCLKFLQPIIEQQLKTNIDMRSLGHCVVFLVNHVLLKIPIRTFKSIQEKWQISEMVLIILNDIVTNYFSNQIIENDHNEIKPVSPGELLVNDLLRGGVLNNLLTTLIADGCEKLFEYVSFTGEQELSRSLVLIMELLESVTISSQQILQTDKSSTFTFCQTPIDRIVTDANTKGLFPNIMKLIDMIDYFPKLANQALSIFAKTLSEDKLQKPFLRLLPKDHKEKAILRNGIVRCLEFAEPDADNNEVTDDSDLKARMRYTVLWLLTKSIQSNIGHYLCGFTRQNQLEPIDFYSTLTGKICRVNNCLQAILTFFDDLSPSKIDYYQKSLPLCYEVLYLLCTNHSSNIIKITFDILHENVFVQKQIQLYFPLKTSSSNIFKYSIETYLLRLITQELFHLINEPTVISKNLIDTTINLLFELIDIKLNRLTLTLLSLPFIKQDHSLINQLKTPNIDLNKINHMLQACQYNERTNLKLYRLDSLRKFLSNEIKTIQTNNNNNDELINETNNNQDNYIHDCKIILAYANQLNNEQIDFYWRNSHIDAWRSLIELILYLNLNQIKTFPFDLCNFLHEKIFNQTHVILDDQQSSHLMNIFLTATASMKQLKITGEYRTNIIAILKNMFDFIQQRFTPKGRAAVYGGMVQSIEIIENVEQQQQQDDLRRIFNNAIEHNHNLLTIIYEDALSNVPAVRSSASSLITSLTTIDISDIIFNNFNQTFLRSLESELRQLMCAVVQSLQTSGTVDLKTWHSFSSYMALLLRISSTNNGAQLLVSSNIFDALLPLMDFHTDTRRLSHDHETNRNGRWMFGRTLAFVVDLTVASLMANVRTKEKIYQFANHLTELILTILASPLDDLCTLHEIDTVLKIIYTLDASTDSNARSIDGQLQRMRQASLKLLAILSRDDLFRHLLAQLETTRARQIISTTYWRICFYVLAIAIRLVHQNNSELTEFLPGILKLCEWITLNTTNLSQAEKSTLFNFCQMPIDRLSTPKMKQDLLSNMMKLMDSSSSLYNPH